MSCFRSKTRKDISERLYYTFRLKKKKTEKRFTMEGKWSRLPMFITKGKKTFLVRVLTVRETCTRKKRTLREVVENYVTLD